MDLNYQTELGSYYCGGSQDLSITEQLKTYKGNIDLIFTSPPFPLNRPKKYGNLYGQEYVDWIASFAPIFKEFLKPTGSIVMEIGNTWIKGQPTMSTWGLRAFLAFLYKGEFNLCQQFIWNNPARLPSPAQWVNVERILVKDSFTYLWWMSSTTRPKANNRHILRKYSDSMMDLLERKSYNSGRRPSEHNIGKGSFLTDNQGAIPSNVVTLSNTRSNSNYLKYCKENNIEVHPARMPVELPEFFIKFLTDEGDIIMDPFAGSNTTGAAAQQANRRWLSIDSNPAYIEGSKGHFFFNQEN